MRSTQRRRWPSRNRDKWRAGKRMYKVSLGIVPWSCGILRDVADCLRRSLFRTSGSSEMTKLWKSGSFIPRLWFQAMECRFA